MPTERRKISFDQQKVYGSFVNALAYGSKSLNKL
jgi:hypothetical protein